MHPFRKLDVWRRAHALVLRVHDITERNYQRKYWSLIDQMRRAAISIPSNIVEGSGHDSNAQFARYLTTALASSRELDYHVLLARDLGLIGQSDSVRLEARVEQVAKMLVAFRRRIVDQIPRSSTRTRVHRYASFSPPSPDSRPPSD